MKDYQDKTPLGVQEMLNIKGFGPKKVKVIWESLQVESLGELLYAINENRLVDLKGFGAKTQATLKEQVVYHLESSDKLHYAVAETLTNEFVDKLKADIPNNEHAIVGQLARKNNTITTLEILTTASDNASVSYTHLTLPTICSV